jgi:hypothetical protein
METGVRHDDRGNVIPRKIINKFSCRYNDAVVFSVDLHEAVAANPYVEFYLRDDCERQAGVRMGRRRRRRLRAGTPPHGHLMIAPQRTCTALSSARR